MIRDGVDRILIQVSRQDAVDGEIVSGGRDVVQDLLVEGQGQRCRR